MNSEYNGIVDLSLLSPWKGIFSMLVVEGIALYGVSTKDYSILSNFLENLEFSKVLLVGIHELVFL